MRFVSIKVGYNLLYYETNLDIMKELNTEPIMGVIENYSSDRNEPFYSNVPLENSIPSPPSLNT
jgi:hypothetical protein